MPCWPQMLGKLKIKAGDFNMKKIILIIFTVFLLASCAMEDVSNNSSDSEIGVRAAGEVAEVSSTSNTSRSITFDKDCLFRSFAIDFGIDWTETEAAHAAGIQVPGLKDGSFGSSWSGN